MGAALIDYLLMKAFLPVAVTPVAADADLERLLHLVASGCRCGFVAATADGLLDWGDRSPFL